MAKVTLETNGAPADMSQPEDITHSQKKSGRFVNPWSTYKDIGFKEVMKMMFTGKNNTRLPKTKEDLDKELPVVKPNLDELKTIPETGMRVTWLGHACTLVQFDGVSILTDPVFSDRCSPFQWIGPRRYRDPPCTIEELPPIDAVIISHNHYDHLDYHSVEALKTKFGAGLKWLVPLGVKAWFSDADNVFEMDWWEEIAVKEGGEVKVVCAPCQHFSNRGLHDRMKTLWCSWIVKGPRHSFYFGGDTAYCDVFKQIGEKYGPFDLAAIPIGAYEPRYFMQCIHVNPAEAVLIHKDVRAKKSLGIHWGTWALAREYYLEPPLKLKEALEAHGIPNEDFFVLNHGESTHV